MRKKIFIGIFLLIAIIGLLYMIIANIISNKNEQIINEYIPEVEISDGELRKTLVKLYFVDNNEEMKSESRLIDSKELLRNPYIALVGMLIEGPKSSELKNAIPEGTKIIDAKLIRKCVTINFSKEFVDNMEKNNTKIRNSICTIVNTLTELNEVQSVKFLINGEEIEGFDENSLKLTNTFLRTDFE